MNDEEKNIQELKEKNIEELKTLEFIDDNISNNEFKKTYIDQEAEEKKENTVDNKISKEDNKKANKLCILSIA